MAEVGAQDRRALRRQSAALSSSECAAEGDDETLRLAIESADRDRRAHGLPPLKTEVEFHRNAVERGLISR